MKFVLIFALAFLAVSLFVAVPTMLLWNWLMPDIFGLPTISFWQALGLAILVRVLFSIDNAGIK